MRKLAIIDGSGFIFRAFHALPPLTTSKGIQTNAVYGFIRMVLSLIDSLKVNYLAVAFDASRKNFRNEIYNEYKANRPNIPEELTHQFDLVRKAVEALNIVSLEKVGYEADDVIATYCDIAEKQGFEIVIVSSDKDLMQLIKSPTIYMYDPVKRKYIKETEVITKFGLPPEKLIYAQALIGDSIDNVPGIKGLGPITAAKLIKQFDTLEGIYSNIEKITQKTIKEKLLLHKSDAFTSLQLVTLNKNVPLITPLENLQIKPTNPYTLYNFCNNLEFKSLAISIAKKYNLDLKNLQTDSSKNNSHNEENINIEKTNISENNSNLVNKHEFKIINQVQDLENLANTLNLSVNLYCYFDKNILAIVDDSSLVYLIIINKQEQLFSLLTDNVHPFSNITPDDLKKFLEPLFMNEGIKKVVFDLKSFIYFLTENNINSINGYDDLLVMSYVLNGPLANNSLEEVFQNTLLTSINNIETNLASKLPDEQLSFLLQKVLSLKQLYSIFKQKIVFEKGKYVYEYIDKPLIKTLYYMEQKGVLIKQDVFKEIDSEITKQLNLLEQEIFSITNEEFNLSSPKQIGNILYNKLNIKGKKNKSGSWKTDAYFLEELDNQGIHIAGLILNWRKFSKLKTTYINTLPSYLNSKDGRIHSTFLQTSTNTGRISSLEPNLQNIPIKTDIGKNLRKAFIAEPNYKIISLDYSQIELRLLAHIANIDSLIEAFKQGKDIHKATAKEIFGLQNDEITNNHRMKAKTINFGIIYGISEFGLAKRLQLDKNEAKIYIEKYFEKYPEILNYMEKAKNEARTNGYVLTEFGRKCYISGINSNNHTIRSFAERAAINAKLQGTAADIMRLCLIKCHNILKKYNSNANLILQIHDEILIEAKETIANNVAKIAANIMQNISSLKVPLVVNYSIGDNWLEAH